MHDAQRNGHRSGWPSLVLKAPKERKEANVYELYGPVPIPCKRAAIDGEKACFLVAFKFHVFYQTRANMGTEG